jgi:hypothetical protein
MSTTKAATRFKRIAELEAFLTGHEISIANGATPQYDDNGNVVENMATCGNCGMTWNDALITSSTPSPSGRCPYEYIHDEIMELRRLKGHSTRKAPTNMHPTTTPTSTARHTPGPFTHIGRTIYGANNTAIACTKLINVPDYEQQANAAFIVTACNAHHDLLEACKELLDGYRFTHDTGMSASHYTGMMDRAKSAIAKAKAGGE